MKIRLLSALIVLLHRFRKRRRAIRDRDPDGHGNARGHDDPGLAHARPDADAAPG
ncbi:hypothetical protein [Methanoculleus bourgensis]|uniref:hypothetical protein n=1 Tax=Methanoculleus bourgensis TaxID=83986 RepID=UPI0012E05DAA|nr:hypothetical protein [Methanoculleus bourgensis]